MVYVSRDLVRCLEFTARPIGMYRGWMHPDKESVALSLYCILDGHMIMGLHHTKGDLIVESPYKYLMATPYVYKAQCGSYRIRVQERVVPVIGFFLTREGEYNLLAAESEDLVIECCKACKEMRLGNTPIVTDKMLQYSAMNAVTEDICFKPEQAFLKIPYMNLCRELGVIE